MTKEKRSPWFWIPSLYYAEGMPYIIVMTVSVIFYKRMGISNTDIALYTSWLYLPWVIKPLWSPLVDLLRTKRFWIITMQLLIGAGLGGVALTIPLPDFFKFTLGFFWLLAFSSATHDIAIDGFYMLGLTRHQQAWYIGFRATFYRFAMITGQGLLIIFAGYLESATGLPPVDIKVIAVSDEIRSEQLLKQKNESHKDVFIIAEPKLLKIPIKEINQSHINTKIDNAEKENKGAQTKENVPSKEKGAEKTSQSFLDKYVIERIENFLRSHFRAREKPPDVRGNTGVIQFHLSRKPEQGRKIVLNFSQISGDKSISLLKGNRFTFTEDNWDKPAKAVIQLDHRLKEEAEAVFSVRSGNIPLAWSLTFASICILFFAFFIYHKIFLPFPDSDKPTFIENSKAFFYDYLNTLLLFFKKDRIIIIIAFLLFFRFGEAQLVKIASPFLLDAQEVGGLGLTTGQVGFVYGTLGLILLTFGGILGGFLASKHGLKSWIWWMTLAVKLPDIVYVYLASTLPDKFFIVSLCVGLEQFGYGFGFTAYMLYMIHVADGEHKTAHFAMATGFMALGMMIPGMFSGWLQELIGYKNFFIWVLLATIPGLIILKYIPLDPEFGKKQIKRMS
jgi:PAT family beta-lactamase induction signal transducer AmpG